MGLGMRIKKCRDVRGMSQAALAERMGMKNASVIANWELGYSRPDVEKICKMCDVLEVSADFLLGRVTEEDLVSDDVQTVMRKYVAIDDRGQMAVKAVLEHEYQYCSRFDVMDVCDMMEDACEQRYIIHQKYISRSHPQYYEMMEETKRMKALRKERGKSYEGILYYIWSTRPTINICLADIVAVFHGVRIPSPEFGHLIKSYLCGSYKVTVM